MKMNTRILLIVLVSSVAAPTLASEYMLVASTAVPGSFHPPDQWGVVLRFGFDGTGPLHPMSTIPQELLSDPIGLAFNDDGDLFVGNRFANQGDGSISRFLFDSAGDFAPGPTIIGNGLSNVHDIAFSPTGELFATNHGSDAVSRFVFDEFGNAVPNGTIATGFGTSYGVGFSNDGELFVADGSTRINRYLFDPLSGAAILNGFFDVPGSDEIRSLEFNDQNELFIPDHDANLVFRYVFDALGHPIPNGTIAVPGAIGVDFSPEGEAFVASHFVGGIQRFLFDDLGNAIPNGTIPTTSLGSIAVVEIPEPSTGLLLTTAGLFVLRRRLA